MFGTGLAQDGGCIRTLVRCSPSLRWNVSIPRAGGPALSRGFRFRARSSSLALALGAWLGPYPVIGQALTGPQLTQLEFRHIGPVGNRISAVYGVPDDPRIYYAGAASGGLWKSEDGGLYWQPVFDEQDAHSIGSLDVSPSDPNVVWVGTGEPHIRSNVTIGDGVYRSSRRRGSLGTPRALGDRTDQQGPRPSFQSGPRLYRFAWAHTRPATGAGHLSHPRRRRDLGTRALRRRADRCQRSRYGPQQSAHPVRGHVEHSVQHLGPREWRCVRWDLHEPRRGATPGASWKGTDCRACRSVRLGICMSPADSRSRLRADRDGGRRALEGTGDRER